MATTHEAKLLILDEPTAGLDVIVRDEFLEMLQDYMSKGERSILISSHISSDLESLCDDFYMIHDGKIIMHEETDILLSEYGILKPTTEQYQTLDKKYLLKVKEEAFGYRCLTNERQYYMENYPDIIIEKGNIDEIIFYNTMRDLRYKLEECRLVRGKYGTFVPWWYKGFFEMKIFALGRLQFEINYTWFDCEVDGKHIPKDTKVLSVHIPRTGTKLEHCLVEDSYRRAADFFKDEFDNIIFICNSWLLYPWNRSVLKDGSNLAEFYDDFTVVNSGEYHNYSEVWRLFDCLYDGNPDKLPNDTSLRRAYIDRIKSGKPLGYGTGVILYNK